MGELGAQCAFGRTPSAVSRRQIALAAGTAMIPELEDAITCITGVDAARVIANPDGAIDEIHLVGPPGKSPKRIVRDVESLLRARFGVSVDYRKISVVQLPPATRVYTRPKLMRARLLNGGDAVCVTLLGADGECRCQEAVSSGDGLGVARGVARATLTAASHATGVPVDLDLVEVRTFRSGDQEVMFVMVSAKGQGAAEELTGTCIMGECLPTAAAKATLDAINRRLELWSAYADGLTRDSQEANQKGV
jgi:hypothetical protein